MFKQQSPKSTKQLQVALDLTVRIRRKLHSLGYNYKQIRKMILEVVRKVVKIPVEANMDLQKIMLTKLKQKHKEENKVSQKLIIELDIFLNSFYDNYESEDDASKVKLEQINLDSSDRQMDLPAFLQSRQSQRSDMSSSKFAKRSLFSRDVRMNMMQDGQGESVYKKALTRRKVLQNNYFGVLLDDQRV